MVKVKCQSCGKGFSTKPSYVERAKHNYCSRVCQYESMKIRQMVTCQNCHKKVARTPVAIRKSRSGLHFCSHACQLQWHNKNSVEANHPNWRNGSGSYRQRLIRASVVRKCVKCGNKDSRVLSAHHIDQDRSNNDLGNLVWLCANCHVLVHLHGAKIS